MNSYLTEDFLECFRQLPQEIKEKARKNYRFWKRNPNHPSLQFKRVHTREPIYAVRVGIGWRVLGLREEVLTQLLLPFGVGLPRQRVLLPSEVVAPPLKS